MQDYTPERDASLGLVSRLNNLWAQTDCFALEEDYDMWGEILDRIHYTLLYYNELEVEEANNVITKIDFSLKDKIIYAFLSRQIRVAKKNYFKAKPLHKDVTKSKWYHSIQKKDIWLRRKIPASKIYLKENEKGNINY